MNVEQFHETYMKKTEDLFIGAYEDSPETEATFWFFYNACLRSAVILLRSCEGANLDEAPAFKKTLELMKNLIDEETELLKEIYVSPEEKQ